MLEKEQGRKERVLPNHFQVLSPPTFANGCSSDNFSGTTQTTVTPHAGPGSCGRRR